MEYIVGLGEGLVGVADIEVVVDIVDLDSKNNCKRKKEDCLKSYT